MDRRSLTRIVRRAAAASVALVLLGCSDQAPQEAAVEQPGIIITDDPGPDLSGIAVNEDALGEGLTAAGSITGKEGQIKQTQAQFLDLAQQFEERTGRRLSGVELSREQAAILQTMLSREEDVSLRGLLQQILDTRTQIADLEAEIDSIKEQLPAPDVVKRGDTHQKLGIDFLVNNHGLDTEAARELVNRSLLTNELAPGMEVWHFYVDGVYGTTVTQGTAKVSPFFLNMKSYRRMKRQRDEAVELARSLEAEITVLEATRDQLQSDLRRVSADLDDTKAERDDLAVERDLLERDKDRLVAANESVWYHVDTARRLREKDVLAPGGMRLKDWRRDLFDQRLDLREDTSLTVYAEDFGVRRIKKLILLPRERFRDGDDYQVKYGDDGRKATIHLDNISKFKDDAFVVALR